VKTTEEKDTPDSKRGEEKKRKRPVFWKGLPPERDVEGSRGKNTQAALTVKGEGGGVTQANV